MLHSIIGNDILDGLFAKSKNNAVLFSGSVYLGLLTRLPNDNGGAHEDGTYFSEPNDEGYFRVQIDTTSRITKESFLVPAAEDEPIVVDGDTAIPAYVTNRSVIMFPESNVAWDTVVGFGLFRAQSGNTSPFLWGSVTSPAGGEGVIIAEHEVPIIRAGDFKVSLV